MEIQVEKRFIPKPSGCPWGQAPSAAILLAQAPLRTPFDTVWIGQPFRNGQTAQTLGSAIAPNPRGALVGKGSQPGARIGLGIHHTRDNRLGIGRIHRRHVLHMAYC